MVKYALEQSHTNFPKRVWWATRWTTSQWILNRFSGYILQPLTLTQHFHFYSLLFSLLNFISQKTMVTHAMDCWVKDTFNSTTVFKVNISTQERNCFELVTRNPKLTDFEMSPRTKQAAFSLDYADLLSCFVTLCSEGLQNSTLYKIVSLFSCILYSITSK